MKKDDGELGDELRPEYDLRSLRVRRLARSEQSLAGSLCNWRQT